MKLHWETMGQRYLIAGENDVSRLFVDIGDVDGECLDHTLSRLTAVYGCDDQAQRRAVLVVQTGQRRRLKPGQRHKEGQSVKCVDTALARLPSDTNTSQSEQLLCPFLRTPALTNRGSQRPD